jgi:hypothetical protein
MCQRFGSGCLQQKDWAFYTPVACGLDLDGAVNIVDVRLVVNALLKFGGHFS